MFILGRRLAARRAAPLAGAAVLAGLVVLWPASALAGFGNPSYQKVLSATDPTGYIATPASYDFSKGPSVTFKSRVKNLTDSRRTVTVFFTANHILRFRGEDVSDGQPGQAGIAESTFMDEFANHAPDGDDQEQPTVSQKSTLTFEPKESKDLTFGPLPLSSCGYFEVDVASGNGMDILLTGFVRVLGCGQPAAVVQPTPTPTPAAAPTPAPRRAARPQAVGLPRTGAHVDDQTVGNVPAWTGPATVALVIATGWLAWRRRRST